MFCKIALGNARRSAKDFAVYFLTLVLGVSVFYAFNSIADQQAVARIAEGAGSLYELLGMVISAVSAFVAVVLAFLVVYAGRFLMKRRKSELALYLMLGMRRGQVAFLLAMESGLVALASLAVGIAVGTGISQVLMAVSASMFGAEVPGFAFFFSLEALGKTLACFAGIFLVTTLLDSGTVMRARLVDLMAASRKGERSRLRSLPVSFALFLVSCAMIGLAYRLLLESGIAEPSFELAVSTVLVCAGTFLFFFSLSGFLLRAARLCKGVYLRGLSAFTLRQLDARVNSTFVSMAVVCMTLFLALTSVCGGMGICGALQSSLEATTRFDASVTTAWFAYGDEPRVERGSEGADESVSLDMERGLAERVAELGLGSLDSVVARSAQVDFLNSTTVTFGTLEGLAGRTLSEVSGGAVMEGYSEVSVPYIPLSQYNEALEMAGEEPISLAEGECALAGDTEVTAEWLSSIARGGGALDVEGTSLTVANRVLDLCLETTSMALQPGAIVVPDAAIPDGLTVYRTILDVDLVDSDSEASARFSELMKAVQEDAGEGAWPVSTSLTREETWQQSMGLTAIVAYLAVYVGFVLVVASAAILAVQQLSSLSENAGRYALLSKLGASDAQVRASVVIQVAACFLFPLVLALAHSACALQTVVDVVAMFGSLDIASATGSTAVGFLALYGLYFALTCWGGVSLARSAR